MGEMGKVLFFLSIVFLGSLVWIMTVTVDMGNCYQIQKKWEQRAREAMISQRLSEKGACLEGRDTYLLLEKCWMEKEEKWEKKSRFLSRQAEKLLDLMYGGIEKIKEAHNEECLRWSESLIEAPEEGVEEWNFE